MADQADVCIIGGGIVGLFCALDCAKAGQTVRLIDKFLPGSSRHNIGEFLLQGNNAEILPFMKFSLHCWREAAEEFGQDLGFDELGSAELAYSTANNEKLENEAEVDQQYEFDSKFIGDLKELAENLGLTRLPEEVKGGKISHGDPSIDTVRAINCLRQQVIKNGVKMWGDDTVSEFIIEDGAVKGVKTDSGEECHAPIVYIASGVWSGKVFQQLGLHLPIRPARSHILEVVPTGKMPTMMLSREKKYGDICIKYTTSGRALIRYSGRMDPAQATWSTAVDGPLVRWLQEQAGEMVSSVRYAKIKKISTVNIAVTPDGLPYVGETVGISGLYTAVGFNGKSYAYAAGVAKALGVISRGETLDLDLGVFTATTDRFANPAAPPPPPSPSEPAEEKVKEKEKKEDWVDPFAKK